MPGNSATGYVEYVHRSWPAEPRQLPAIRRALRGWLSPVVPTEEDRADLVQAVDEAAANVVEHAYGSGEPGSVNLALWVENETLCIELTDHGRWRPPPGGPVARFGLGITLMRALVHAVLIRYDSRGTQVFLRHALRGAPAGGPA